MAVNLENDVDLKQRVVGYCLESRPKNAGKPIIYTKMIIAINVQLFIQNLII
jgi:HKD family nuclease